MGEPYRKFTCYFCNQKIENDTEVGHSTICSKVLVPCRNKCGAYVPRIDMERHRNECVNRPNELVPVNRNAYTLEHKSNSLVNGFLPQQPREDISLLQRRLVNLEQAVVTNLNTKQPNIQQYVDKWKNHHIEQKHELEKFKYQNQIVLEWKKTVEFQLDNMKHQIDSIQKILADSEVASKDTNEQIGILNKVQMEIRYSLDRIYNEQEFNRNASLEANNKIDAFKDFYSEESATTAAVWHDLKNEMDAVRKDVNLVVKNVEEQKLKLASIVFDFRAVSQIASEAAEKVEIQERECETFKKEISQMKLDIEILEGLMRTTDNLMPPGKFLWKITDVSKKLEDAKEHNTVLKSPVFLTHDFGYKIRIILYLNGLKKWKDRHALLCIQVVKGEYDMLLQWPCQIEGTVSLRDLEYLDHNARPFVKAIVAKRLTIEDEGEEPQESSPSYIFIAHTVLFKERHMKDDTIFLEFNMKDKQQKLNETNL